MTKRTIGQLMVVLSGLALPFTAYFAFGTPLVFLAVFLVVPTIFVVDEPNEEYPNFPLIEGTIAIMANALWLALMLYSQKSLVVVALATTFMLVYFLSPERVRI